MICKVCGEKMKCLDLFRYGCYTQYHYFCLNCGSVCFREISREFYIESFFWIYPDEKGIEV